jgi:D-alanine transaminase
MNPLIWLNGDVMPMSQATIGVEDRGFQFADGVYEVVRIYNGRHFTLAEHMQRLARSADGIRMTLPMPIEQIAREVERFVPRTGLRDGTIYLQATRGVAPRNHVFPKNPGSTLLFYSKPLAPPSQPGQGDGLKLLTVADERWKRCWVKTIGLIGHILAKNEAVDRGYDEAAFVDDGLVSECSTSNLFIVAGGKLITHPVGARVLPGITRLVVLDCAQEMGIPIDERPLRESEVVQADELFITSTTKEVAWVARWNDQTIGSGRPGPLTIRLHQAFQGKVHVETDPAPSAKISAA